MKPLVTYPDATKECKDALQTLWPLYWRGPLTTIGIGVPTKWTPLTSGPHLQVSLDGTPIVQGHPIRIKSSIRVAAWSNSVSLSKEMATLSMGLLLAFGSWGQLAGTRPLTGPITARDEDTKAELCYISVSATIRSIPVLPI